MTVGRELFLKHKTSVYQKQVKEQATNLAKIFTIHITDKGLVWGHIKHSYDSMRKWSHLALRVPGTQC